MLIAGNQKTAHAGFQVHGQFGRLIEVIDDPIGVLHPLDHRQQICNQTHEKHRTEYAHTEGQCDVSAQQCTKALFIDGRRGSHGHALAKCVKPEVCPKVAVERYFSATSVHHCLHKVGKCLCAGSGLHGVIVLVTHTLPPAL